MSDEAIVACFLIVPQQFSVRNITFWHSTTRTTLAQAISPVMTVKRIILPADTLAGAGHVLFLSPIDAESCFKHSGCLKWATYDLNIGFQSPCISQSGVTCREAQILLLTSGYQNIVLPGNPLKTRQAASFNKDAICGNGAYIVWIRLLEDTIRIGIMWAGNVQFYKLVYARFSINLHFTSNTVI